MNSTHTINREEAVKRALGILYMFRNDLVPERSYAEALTGTVSNWHRAMSSANDYIALLEGMLDDGAEDRVTVALAPVSADEARAVWREVCDADGMPYDDADYDEWVRIRIQEREATEMTAGVVTELVMPMGGWC